MIKWRLAYYEWMNEISVSWMYFFVEGLYIGNVFTGHAKKNRTLLVFSLNFCVQGIKRVNKLFYFEAS